jgi:type II secretory ATPase GspE/PulE/Tfp pilus assembly ATPase PilB-like protein
MLAPSINLVVGQRLVRKVCPHCSSRRKASYSELEEINDSINRIKQIDPDKQIIFD